MAYYGTRPDPRSDDGRFDALPRLGAAGGENELTARIRVACVEGCGIVRRGAVLSAVTDATEACVGGAGPRRAQAKRDAERERNRPRNRAEQIACILKCKGDAHLAFDASGAPYAAPSGWCGTDAFTCWVSCQPRGDDRGMPWPP